MMSWLDDPWGIVILNRTVTQEQLADLREAPFALDGKIVVIGLSFITRTDLPIGMIADVIVFLNYLAKVGVIKELSRDRGR